MSLPHAGLFDHPFAAEKLEKTPMIADVKLKTLEPVQEQAEDDIWQDCIRLARLRAPSCL